MSRPPEPPPLDPIDPLDEETLFQIVFVAAFAGMDLPVMTPPSQIKGKASPEELGALAVENARTQCAAAYSAEAYAVAAVAALRARNYRRKEKPSND